MKELIARCDDVFRRIVWRRGSCECPCRRCGGPLQCAHVISRRKYPTRWREDGALALCKNCHYYWTRNPERWREFVGERKYDQLLALSEMVGSKIDYQLLLLALEARAREVGALLPIVPN